MKITFEINNEIYSGDTSHPLEISIPMNFNSDQPNTYDIAKASSAAVELSGFIGDTRRGGGCNFEEYRIVPHCNGTHTEGVGHISLERISINKILKDIFIPATLISIAPEKASATNEKYIPQTNENDFLITRKLLKEKLDKDGINFLEGLIVRTLPNDESKKNRNYMSTPPPFFSIEAMKYIDKLNVKHLLLDIPSVDRTFDEGKLSTHHIFWNVALESKEVDRENHSVKTITEMIYASDEIKDGRYMINIQIPDFVADAAPSRVLLFQIND